MNLLPQKRHFENYFSMKTFSKNINLIALIYSSSETSELSEEHQEVINSMSNNVFLNVFTLF